MRAMKKHILRALSLALALCLALSVTALADVGDERDYAYLTITAADGSESSYPLSADASGSGWSWAAASETLTLSDYHGSHVQFNGHYESGFDIKVVLNGASTIDGSLWFYRFGNAGADAGSSLTISGSGSLAITANEPLTVPGAFTMESGTLTLNSDYEAYTGPVTMNGGTLVINAPYGGGNALVLNGGLVRYIGRTEPSYAPSYSWDTDAPIHFNGGSLSVDQMAYFSGALTGDYTVTMADGSAGAFEDVNGTLLLKGAFPATLASAGSGTPVEPEEPTEPAAPVFTDVAESDYYYAPIQWAVENGVTTGTSATTFSPASTCTTAQILTFLWRAVGSPAPAGENPFSDVAEDVYYADAAAWAHEQGLVSGETFNGDAPCTRSAVVTYLWKLAEEPEAEAAAFTDVAADADYAQAVAWAVSEGITTGTSDTTFSPDSTCTRGQIVTFLYRDLAETQE